MAVVKKHAKKLEEIRTSPERYDRIKGKIKTKNPFAANLSSVTGITKRSMMNMTGGVRGNGDPVRPPSPIKEETAKTVRGISVGAKPTATDETRDWYKPELGEIPQAPLTRANREKIEKRDREIAEKEAELEKIMSSINQRKQERAEKEALFKAQDDELKKKRKLAKKAQARAQGIHEEDQDEAPAPIELEEPLDEEGQRKKDAVLESLQ